MMRECLGLRERVREMEGERGRWEREREEREGRVGWLEGEVKMKDEIIDLQQRELENEVRKRQKLEKKWDRAYKKATQNITQLTLGQANP